MSALRSLCGLSKKCLLFRGFGPQRARAIRSLRLGPAFGSRHPVASQAEVSEPADLETETHEEQTGAAHVRRRWADVA